jgi:tetratricopeptide (TPR) repeat protein
MSAKRKPPLVFISFAHGTDAHDARVRGLAEQLRRDGVDARTYLTELFPEEGFILWMEREIRSADFVLMVCDAAYRRRSEGDEEPGVGTGVRWEARFIANLLHREGGINRKFIPVIFAPGDRVHIPTRFGDYPHFVVAEPGLDDPGYADLYRVVTGQPPVKVPIGGLVTLDALPPQPSAGEILARPWNAPPRNPFFTGRDDVLDRIRGSLLAGGRTALSGLGGMGKTQTALQYAYRHRGDHTAVFWIRADSEISLSSGFREIARLVLGPGEGEAHDAVHRAREWLATHPGWLIVFDNADVPDVLRPWLPPEGAGHVLLTSRAEVFDTVGIAAPVLLDQMGPAEARELLLRRTGRNRPGPGEAAAAAELAGELGYLPLALEQAGAFILENGSRFQDYLSGFRKTRLGLLEQHGPVAGDYPASVRTTWTINFAEVEKQSPASAELLRLSAFLSPDSVPHELLAAGAHELGPILSAALAGAGENPLTIDVVLTPLARFSLIRRDVEARTFGIHRMVQAVVSAGMQPSVHRLWAKRVVRAVSAAFPAITYGNWPSCERLLPQARIGAKWIDAMGLSSPEATTLVYRAGVYLRERGFADEAMRFSQRAAEIGKGVEHPGYGISLISLAAAQRDRKEYEAAEKTLVLALANAQSVPEPDETVVAACVNNLGDVYRLLGRFEEAEPLLRQALATRVALCGENDPSTARSHHDLGVLLLDTGAWSEAEAHLLRALEVRRALLQPGDPDLARSLDTAGRLYTRLGRHGEAEAMFREAIGIGEASLGRDHPRLALMYRNYAELLAQAGRHGEADEYGRRAEAVPARGEGPDPTSSGGLH